MQTCIENFELRSTRVDFCRAIALVSLLMAAFSVPIAFARLDLQSRDALAGSDALLERGVIPPNQLDWIMVDCSRPESQSNPNTLCEITKSERE